MILGQTLQEKFCLQDVGGGILYVVFRDNCRPEVARGNNSGVTVEEVSSYAAVKFGDSSSNRFKDMRPAHFVMDDERRRTTTVAAHDECRKRRHGVSPKKVNVYPLS